MTVEELSAKYGKTVSRFFRGTAKPYVRWWWLAGPFTREDIVRQLQWVGESGFGGVELAWIYPAWLDDDPGLRPDWLGPEWTDLVAFTKQTADELGLGCDFTFGSCWPFGGSWVKPEDAARTFTGISAQRLGCSWEQAAVSPSFVINHLSAASLESYAKPLLEALGSALSGSLPALFCDSLELRTEEMWSEELWDEFERHFGYSLRPFATQLDENPEVRYDYRKLIAEVVGREFYQAFTELCRANGAYARVQCHGAPTDLLAAYAAVDVPESEALLFPLTFSRIAASAAAWAGKQIVSAEAFTCLYGFPGWDDSAETYWRKEHLADLKLLADGLFANGVNQIVWHGMPYQPTGSEVEFYASVHVGPNSAWVSELPAFNKYLEEVCTMLRTGRPYTALGIYLPFEDALMQDRITDEERTPGANYHWEMRHAVPPEEVAGFHPLWISQAFLGEARVERGLVCSRELALECIYVDCEWLDRQALTALVRLAEAGARVICRRRSRQPGHRQDDVSYSELLDRLVRLSTAFFSGEPLLSGKDLPTYSARVMGDELLLFVAHPAVKEIRYPMEYGFSFRAGRAEREVVVRWRGRESNVHLHFEGCDSLLLIVDSQGTVTQVQVADFRPQARKN